MLAMLVSALLAQQVLSGLALGVALRFVLLALRQQPSSRPFAFGLAVLRQVVRSARPWPAFCEQVLLTPAVRDTAPEVSDAATAPPLRLLSARQRATPLHAARSARLAHAHPHRCGRGWRRRSGSTRWPS